MGHRVVHAFFALALFFPGTKIAVAEPNERKIYAFEFVDADKHQLSTADGHVTTLVFVPSGDVDRAREVGAEVPDFCLGNPHYRMVTVVELAETHAAPVRAVINAVVRRHLTTEARSLQTRYENAHVSRNAREDVVAVVDFNRAIAAHFASDPTQIGFQVVVLNGKGELIRRWNALPTADELKAALAPPVQ